jgi:hypothetical protein
MSALNRPMVWIHGDALSPAHPVWQGRAGAPALFVWDDALLREWRISLKRVAFIYECLLELPVEIRRGDVAAEVLQFARQHGADGIVTPASPSPRFRLMCAALRQSIPVQVVEDVPFLDYDGPLDLQRFSRYWRVASRHAFGKPRRNTASPAE